REQIKAATNQARRVCAAVAGSSAPAATISATSVAGLQRYSRTRRERAFAIQSPAANSAATTNASAVARFTAPAARGAIRRVRRDGNGPDREDDPVALAS